MRQHFAIVLAAIFLGWSQGPCAEQNEQLAPVPATPRLTAQLGHGGPITAVAITPNGLVTVTTSMDQTVRVWESATGKELLALQTGPGGAAALAVFPNNQWCATTEFQENSGRGIVRVWDLGTGRTLRSITAHFQPIPAVQVMPDGSSLWTGSRDGTVCGWDARTGRRLSQFVAGGRGVVALACSADSRMVAAGCEDGTAHVWDTRTGKRVHQLSGEGPALAIGFTSDRARAVIVHGTGVVQVIAIETGRVRKVSDHAGTLKAAKVGVRCAAINPTGLEVTVGLDVGGLKVWNLASGKTSTLELAPLPARSRSREQHQIPLAIAYLPNGDGVLVGCSDATARQIRSVVKQSLQLRGCPKPKSRQALFIDGYPVFALHYRSGGYGIWLPGKKTEWRVKSPPTAASPDWFEASCPLGLVPDRPALFAGSQTSLHVWDMARPGVTHVFDLPAKPTGIVAARGGPVAVCMTDQVWIWDLATEVRKAVIPIRTVPEVIAFLPDSKQMVIGDGKSLRIVNTADGVEHRAFQDELLIRALAVLPGGQRVVVAAADNPADVLSVRDLATGEHRLRLTGWKGQVAALAVSPDGRWIAAGTGHPTDRRADNRVVVWDATTGRYLYDRTVSPGEALSLTFSSDGKWLVTGSGGEMCRMWDAASGREACRFLLWEDSSWAVIDPDGRYDASNGGDVDGLHWVVGQEVVALSQLKHRYYEPGLLAKLLGFNKDPLRKVEAFREVKLYPRVAADAPVRDAAAVRVKLSDRGGGIGKVQVLVNGKELLADARGPKFDASAREAALTIDLSTASNLIPGKENVVTIVAFNAEGYLSSRGMTFRCTPPGKAQAYKPDLYAIVCGVSHYADPSMNLRYAAKDAEDFAAALELAGRRFLEPHGGKVHLTLLTASNHPHARPPTKDNLHKVFAAARKARPDDILVVYLAGHGTTLQRGSDLYCYLTRDARTLDPAALADPAVLTQVAVTSEELTEWFKQVPALRQVMVLDTCAAGAAVARLTEKRDVPGDQVRALERLKDRTGFHVLMGCAADRVSYEATRYAQGLLTYSLLEGMKGRALREGEYVDVSKLFAHAVDRVPELAGQVGGVQRPLVAAPRGSSFDIGRLTAEDRPKVPLAVLKPLVLRPTLLNADALEDDRKLSQLFVKQLEEESAAARGRDPALVYVPENDFPGAIRPTGTYAVAGTSVTVRLLLKRDGQTITRLELRGTTDDLPELAARLTREVTAAAKP